MFKTNIKENKRVKENPDVGFYIFREQGKNVVYLLLKNGKVVVIASENSNYKIGDNPIDLQSPDDDEFCGTITISD